MRRARTFHCPSNKRMEQRLAWTAALGAAVGCSRPALDADSGGVLSPVSEPGLPIRTMGAVAPQCPASRRRTCHPQARCAMIPAVPTFRRVGVEPGVRACLGVGTALAKVVEPGRIEFKPGIRLRPLLAAHMRGHGAMESEGVGRQARRGSGIMACRRLGWRKRGVSLAAAPLFTCQSPGPWIVVVSDPRVARSLEIVTARGAGRLRWLSSARVQRPLLCSPSPLPARGEG